MSAAQHGGAAAQPATFAFDAANLERARAMLSTAPPSSNTRKR